MRKTDDDIIIKMLDEGHTQKQIAEYFGVSPAAICKRVKRLEAYPKSLNDLTPKEQRFALSIAEGKSQTASAIDAYDVSSMDSAKSLGRQLMKKPKVNAAISELMEYHGIGRPERIKRLASHIYHRDPNISLKALDQSWKLDNSYNEPQVAVQINIKEVIQSREESEKIIAEARARLKELKVMDAEDSGM